MNQLSFLCSPAMAIVCVCVVLVVMLVPSEIKSESLYTMPYLGLTTIDIEQAENKRELEKQGIESGALVTGVTGPAADSGIRIGDVILIINGTKVNVANDISIEWAKMNPGSVVRLIA